MLKLLHSGICHTPRSMSAHALPYGPGELVRLFAQARTPLRLQLASLALRVAPGVALDLIGRRLVKSLDRLAVRQSAIAVSLEGLIGRVLETPEEAELDADDLLNGMLARFERTLRQSAVETRSIWQIAAPPVRSRREAIRLAALRIAVAAEAAADATRELRGAIQAHDANVSAMNRARRPAHTADELDAHLDAAEHAQ